MIKVVMIKASDPWWYEIKIIPNLEALIAIYRKEGDLILRDNWTYKDDPEDIAELLWGGMSLEDAKEVSECEFMLEIYDDYIE